MAFEKIRGYTTPVGRITIETQEDGQVDLEVRPSNPDRFHRSIVEKSDKIRMSMWESPRRPAKGDEVTINGSAFEVQGTREEPDGGFSVKDEMGGWVRWNEDA